MRNSLLVLFIFALIFSSCEQPKKFLSDHELLQEKEKVKSTIETFHKVSEEKDFSKMVNFLSDEVIFFGTDSTEVFKTFAEYKRAIDEQNRVYDKIEYSSLQDEAIFIDPDGQLATIFYGTYATTYKAGIKEIFYLRGARVLEKKEDKWLIKGGLTGIVRSQQPHTDVVTPVDTNMMGK